MYENRNKVTMRRRRRRRRGKKLGRKDNDEILEVLSEKPFEVIITHNNQSRM
jgi:hypothetical protein